MARPPFLLVLRIQVMLVRSDSMNPYRNFSHHLASNPAIVPPC